MNVEKKYGKGAARKISDTSKVFFKGIKYNEGKNIPTSEEQLDAQPVFHKVYIVVHKERLIIHGVFSTEEKAKRYIKDSDCFGIMKCDVI